MLCSSPVLDEAGQSVLDAALQLFERHGQLVVAGQRDDGFHGFMQDVFFGPAPPGGVQPSLTRDHWRSAYLGKLEANVDAVSRLRRAPGRAPDGGPEVLQHVTIHGGPQCNWERAVLEHPITQGRYCTDRSDPARPVAVPVLHFPDLGEVQDYIQRHEAGGSLHVGVLNVRFRVGAIAGPVADGGGGGAAGGGARRGQLALAFDWRGIFGRVIRMLADAISFPLHWFGFGYAGSAHFVCTAYLHDSNSLYDLHKVLREMDARMRSRVPEIDLGAIAEWVGSMTNIPCICTLESMQIEASPLPNLCRALERELPKSAAEASDIKLSLLSFLEGVEGTVLVPKLLGLFERGSDYQKRLAGAGLAKIVTQRAALADHALRGWAQAELGIDYLPGPAARAAPAAAPGRASEGGAPERLAPDQPGTPVAVHGLAGAPRQSGLSARAVRFVEETGRYAVQLSGGGEQMLVRPEDLRPEVPHAAKAVEGRRGVPPQEAGVRGRGTCTYCGVSYSGEGAEDGLPHGGGTGVYPDGASYDGEWYKGRRHGRGKHSHPDGRWYDGMWCDDQRSGRGSERLADGRCVEVEYAGGRRLPAGVAD